MPLKHTTETLLVFLLAVVTIVTGMLMQTLADISNGLVPWLVVFVLTIIYPLSLARLFRRNRADYEFRILHWVPTIMLLLWLVLQGGSLFVPKMTVVFDWYTWGWSLPAVATGFLLLAVFVLKVLRRWVARVGLLLFAFIPFMIGGVANEYYDWSPQMAAMLWQAEWWQLDTSGSGVFLADADNSNEKNLAASDDLSEERYRDNLRAVENRKERIARRIENRDLNAQEEVALLSASSSSSVSEPPSISSVSSMPSRLPSSGFGWGAIVLFLCAGYCGSVHRSAIRREKLNCYIVKLLNC